MEILFLDDLRNPIDIFKGDVEKYEFKVVRTVEEAIEVLKLKTFDKWSLDHDLGEELTGYDLVKIIAYEHPELWCSNINVHSANPVGRKNIEKFVENYNLHLSSLT